jgi:hypothetical protein
VPQLAREVGLVERDAGVDDGDGDRGGVGDRLPRLGRADPRQAPERAEVRVVRDREGVQATVGLGVADVPAGAQARERVLTGAGRDAVSTAPIGAVETASTAARAAERRAALEGPSNATTSRSPDADATGAATASAAAASSAVRMAVLVLVFTMVPPPIRSERRTLQAARTEVNAALSVALTFRIGVRR